MKRLKIKDLPKYERPRERLLKLGATALSDSELLAIVLRAGSKKENILDLSRRLVKDHNLKSLSKITVNQLSKTFGIGQAKACQIVACFELGRRLAAYSENSRIMIESPADVVKIVGPELRSLDKEHFICLLLDSRKRLIKKETIFIGTLDASITHPREIFKVAIAASAAAIILVHNHPSGDSTPSKEDIEFTLQLIEAGKLLEIDILDHIIIGDKNFFSFKKQDII